MRIKKLFGTLVLGGALSVGVAALIGAGVSKTYNKSAEAAGSTRRFFLDCTQHSGYDDAQSIGIQYYTDSYIKKEATKLADNYWYVDVPSSNLTKVQFFRCDTGNVEHNYNWQWEGNPAEVNYYSVKGWDNNGDWSNANGADETYEVASTSPSTSTKRIWVDPKDNFYDGNARAALRTFSGANHLKTYILGGSTQFKVVDGQYLFYVDIPVAADCQLVRLHNAFNIIWTYGGNFSDISGYNTANVVYSWNAAAEYSAANEDNPTVDYAKAVLDGYSTCESSALNGYGNFNNIKTGILDKLSAANLSTLRSSTFTAAGGYGTRTYGEKIDLMSAQKNGVSSRVISPILNNENTTSFAIIIVATLVAVSAVGGYFFLRRKKAN